LIDMARQEHRLAGRQRRPSPPWHASRGRPGMANMKNAEEALRELSALAADRSQDGLAHIMAVARRRLDMDVCVLAEFTSDREVIRAVEGKDGAGLKVGASWPAAETLGQRILDGRIWNVVPDVAADLELASI